MQKYVSLQALNGLRPCILLLTMQIYIKNMIKTRKMKRIFVPDVKNVRKMIERYKCSKCTVYNALAYKTNSEQSQRIRNDALNLYGGVVINETKI